MSLRSLTFAAALVAAASAAPAAEPPREPSPERGYEVLRTKQLLPPDFDRDVFENLWTVWPADLKEKAAKATPGERRRLAFDRYGLHEPPEAPAGYDGPAIGYVDDRAGGWVMNCFACHAGSVAGRTVPGAPNADIDLQSLVEDVTKVKLAAAKPLGHLDLAALRMPLGGTRGTTNSVVFGIVLDGLRKPDMSIDLDRKPSPLVHHDMDAPAWWNVKKKSHLYVDGFAPKNHRILMQFMLLPRNDRETVYGWEDDFRDVLAYIDSLEPPQYPGPVDAALAERGKALFEANCAKCHGTYAASGGRGSRRAALPEKLTAEDAEGRRGRSLESRAEKPTSAVIPLRASASSAVNLLAPDAARPDPRPPEADTYPETIVPIADLGTDPVRLEALTVKHREHLETTWMTDYGRDRTITDPGGYVAPPLDGVWATAPYFHNGSVPTLWHVLRPDERPKVWKRDRTGDGYDHDRVGLAVEATEAVPKGVTDPSARREFFDTAQPGKSAAGHDFPDALTDDEKRAVLEYLKTL